MAKLFTDLLDRLGPAETARRLNITQRTARALRIAPLSRFPRVAVRAESVTARIKRSILDVAGMSPTEAARHTRKSFGQVEGIRKRVTSLVETLARNALEVRAKRVGLEVDQFISAFPDEFEDKKSSIRGGMRQSDRRFELMERDSP